MIIDGSTDVEAVLTSIIGRDAYASLMGILTQMCPAIEVEWKNMLFNPMEDQGVAFAVDYGVEGLDSFLFRACLSLFISDRGKIMVPKFNIQDRMGGTHRLKSDILLTVVGNEVKGVIKNAGP